MAAPGAFQAGDVVAMPAGGRLCLLRVLTSLDDLFVLADESDLRRRVVMLTAAELEKRAEKVRS